MFLSDPIYQRIYDMLTQGSVDTSRQCKPIFTPNNKEENIYRILVLYTLFFMLTDWQYILLHVCPNNNSFRATSG